LISDATRRQFGLFCGASPLTEGHFVYADVEGASNPNLMLRSLVRIRLEVIF
jgi:hypothetical protein